MMRKIIVILGLVSAIALITICIYISSFILRPSLEANARENRIKNSQEELAMQLGVRIQDFTPITDFPTTYFANTLKSGMTYEKVHAIIRGYKEVFKCGDQIEIYDYFNIGDDRYRFEVRYKDSRYIGIVDEDPYIHNLEIYPGCSEGLIGQ
jgi:hypothetical protein